MKRLLFLIALGVGGAYLIRTYLGVPVRVATGSMEPTLEVNEIYWASNWHYVNNPVKRGDIITFRSPVDDKDLIKRVIAVAGDSIEIRNKKVFINWKEIEEPYVQHTRKNEILVGDNISEMTVPDGCVFVMGDNRDGSEDSRDWKDSNGKHIYFINVDLIKGWINAD
ncbi:MAG: signal peptidase I [Elusimicrobia bacterium CG08_land_8_20_14_0_20_44_26]|nr:MAG: signal peptidase I [Elusimicrobia bacterium CG08_land_8_20_14_0_20_44_26]